MPGAPTLEGNLHLRSFALAVALLGCGDNLPSPFVDARTIELAFPSTPNRKLDLLIVSYATPGGDETHHLGKAIGALLAPLTTATGELPDLHIGVTTMDMGTTGSDDPAHPGPSIGQLGSGGCAGAGRDGRLLTFDAPVTEPFFIDESDGNGGRRRNYDGDLADVLRTVITGTGQGDCGFEQPLQATRRALTNPANAGFLRPDAHLGIVIASAEDDCSARHAGLFSTDTSVLGPLQTFRCTPQGVVCDQPLDSPGVKTGCAPRSDSEYVEPIELTSDALRGLKRDPSQLSFGVLIAPSTPFEIQLRAAPGGGTTTLGLGASCSISGPSGLEVANPAVRLESLARSFGGRGAIGSLCSLDYAPGLAEVARILEHPLGVVCLDTSILKDSSTEPGIQPACELTEVAGDVETEIPACPLADDCFEIVEDAAACPQTTDHRRLIVHRSSSPGPDAYVRARCEVP